MVGAGGDDEGVVVLKGFEGFFCTGNPGDFFPAVHWAGEVVVAHDGVAPVEDEGFGLLAGGYWLLAIGCWLLAFGYWLLAVGCWLLAIGYWLLAVGCWLLAFGYWLLAIGCWLWHGISLIMRFLVVGW